MRRTRMTAATAALAAAAATGWVPPAAPNASAETGTAPAAVAVTAPPAARTLAAPAGSPVAVNGQLRVCGVNICNEAGRAVQLRGMSSHGLQFFPDCLNQASLASLRNDWKAEFIRISMYVQEGGFETDPQGFTAQVNTAVEQATALGMYAIIDFHILTPGDPDVNLDRARSFFADVAAAHADKINVLYEVANEPNGVSWLDIKAYAEQVIPVIRAESRDSVVLVGTRGFSSLGVSEGADETEVINDPVEAENVAYTFHFYAASHRDVQRETVARAARSLPLFVSEFGTQTFTGDGTNDLASSAEWLDLLRSLKISYSMWSFSDGRETNSAFVQGTCQGTDYSSAGVLTESGRFIFDRISTGTPAGS